MPRRAAADFGFPNPVAKRLSPPDDLATGSPEREVFLNIVLTNTADHFCEGECDLLCCHCRAIVRERIASSELQASGYVVDGKPSAWASILKDAVRDLTVTARLLRLTPLARQTSSPKASQPASPLNAYDRIALEAQRDERN